MNLDVEKNDLMKIIHIGMMGLVINNGNMGCVALTYSFISIMEELAHKMGNIVFIYHIFEDMPDKGKIGLMCSKLHLDSNQVVAVKYKKSIFQLSDIKACDIMFDFTEGDSFSDIYGNKRFLKNWFYKKMVLLSGKKLILGPQTIGPFVSQLNKHLAKNIIENADVVFSRDLESIDYINGFTTKQILLSTDVAFKLPYKKSSAIEISECKRKIGFNASKLLYFMEYDDKRMHLETNFKSYAALLIEQLLTMNYDVILISHVNGDYAANKEIHDLFSDTILLDKFNDPIEAKNTISKMDMLISPRMHSTIAAYSSGIPVIPLSYSRKFRGLYSEIGLSDIVDMERLDTMDAVNLTVQYIKEAHKYTLNETNKEIINVKINCFIDKIYNLIKDETR